MSAFDTNKPAGICSVSMKTIVGKPVEDFVDFYIPASCLIKCIDVMDGSSTFQRIPEEKAYSQFAFGISLSSPVELMFSTYVAYAQYGYTPNN